MGQSSSDLAVLSLRHYRALTDFALPSVVLLFVDRLLVVQTFPTSKLLSSNLLVYSIEHKRLEDKYVR